MHDVTEGGLATALEERGFESLWYGEHSHIPCSRKTPYPPGGELPDPYLNIMDPYISLMAAAAATTTLKLGTGIALLMERDIFSQAKTIATLDQLSGGRVIIGTGVGWNEEEFANANPHPFNKRYAVLRETVAATRALWRDEQAEYHGDYIDFDPVWCNPKPLQPGGPKIYMGAMGPLDPSAALADFRNIVEDCGRDPAEVAICIQIMDTANLDKLKEYRDLGVERATVGVSTDLWDKPEAVMPLIDRCAKLIPELKI